MNNIKISSTNRIEVLEKKRIDNFEEEHTPTQPIFEVK